MKKRFGELFLNSWKEYKLDYRVFVLIILLLIFLPSVVNYVCQFPWSPEILKLGDNPNSQDILNIFYNYKYVIILSILAGIVSFILAILSYVTMTYGSLNKKKEMSFSESLIGGKKNFWRYLGFMIVSVIFMLGLYLLLIIPGIIFSVYWIFSSFIFIKEKKGIIESLRGSYKMVKGNWWRTFGYSLLFFLIILGISFVFSLVSGLILFIINPASMSNDLATINYYSNYQWYLGDAVSLIINFTLMSITIPLSLLFFKNFYLSMKEK
jgi:magnesium-transporting ATPase (P-type)